MAGRRRAANNQVWEPVLTQRLCLIVLFELGWVGFCWNLLDANDVRYFDYAALV